MNRLPRCNKAKFAINGWLEIVFRIYVSIWKRFLMEGSNFYAWRAFVSIRVKTINFVVNIRILCMTITKSLWNIKVSIWRWWLKIVKFEVWKTIQSAWNGTIKYFFLKSLVLDINKLFLYFSSLLLFIFINLIYSNCFILICYYIFYYFVLQRNKEILKRKIKLQLKHIFLVCFLDTASCKNITS